MEAILLAIAVSTAYMLLYECGPLQLLLLAAIAVLAKLPVCPTPRLPRAWIYGPWQPYLLLVILATLPRLLLLWNNPAPRPYVPDEFSHLFLADTLFSGRLANPTHPMWQHFETLHIFHQPTYSSMYFPGSALFLFCGKLLFGHPFAGVLLVSALFTVALLWMLRAWLPPRWAFYGALLAVLKLSVFSYWSNSYWGGFSGALGGALLCGAAKHFSRRPRWSNGLLLGLSLVLLANTRPLEGLVLAACVGLWLLLHFRAVSRRPPWRQAALAMLATTLVLTLGAAAMATYFQAVTGSPTTIPYAVNQKLYGWPMTAAWMTPVEKDFRHKELRDYWTWERYEHMQVESVGNLFYFAITKFPRPWNFFSGWLLMPALLSLWACRNDRRLWPLALMVLVPAIAVLSEQSSYSHYFAPAAAPLFALIAAGSRRLATCQTRRQAFGRRLVALVPLALLLAAGLQSATPRPLTTSDFDASPWRFCCRYGFGEPRHQVVQQALASPGEDLIFVKYNRNPWVNMEWVYNEPDIDRASVVFARDMGPERNAELIRYFQRSGRPRKTWMVEPDAKPLQFYVYPSSHP